jgi:S1-C subfamily serine protease
VPGSEDRRTTDPAATAPVSNAIAAGQSSPESLSSLPTSAIDGETGASTTELAQLQSRFESVARSVAPSVVAISVAVQARGDDGTVRPDDLTGRKLTELLERTTRTVGTGFFISADGLILTNEHVVAEAQQIWCTTDTGRVLPAFVVGSDPRSDLAVLRVAVTGDLKVSPVTFAPASSVKRGQWAVTLGNPYGLANEGELAMSVGVVSAVGRSLPRLSLRENRLYLDLIQTTAEINPGNSGGPLFNLTGEVIGINTAVVLPQKNANGIGFALPITPSLLARVDMLRQGIEVPHIDLGLTVSQPTARQRKSAGLVQEVGVRVEEIDPQGPCAASLRQGDLLVSLDDQPLADVDAFSSALAGVRAGAPVRMSVVRDGKASTLIVSPRRKSLPSTPISAGNQRFRWNGMLIGPIPDHWEFAPDRRPDYGLMVLSVDPKSRTLLPPGTIVQSLGGKRLRTVADLQAALAGSTPDATSLVVYSPGTPAITSLPADR